MSRRTRRSLLPGITAGTMVAATAAVQAADPPSTQPAFVDTDRVLTVFRKTPAFAQAQKQFSERAKELNEEMAFLAQLRYCTDAERKEALMIRSKGITASAAERSKLDGWLKRADEVENEISRLSQKQNPTPEETNRIKALSDMRTQAAEQLAGAAADRRDQLRDLDNKLTEQVQEEILKLVERVAKDQRAPVVYARSAILFGGTDLTDHVIRKVGK